MNISTMHRVGSGFNFELAETDQREIFTDCDLGEISIGPMLDNMAGDAPAATAEHDPDSGPILVPARPDRHGGRRYTGPPALVDVLLIVYVATSIACTGLVAYGVVIGG